VRKQQHPTLVVHGWYLEVFTCSLHHLAHRLIVGYELTHLPQYFLCPAMHLAFQMVSVILVLPIARTWHSALTNRSSVLIDTAQSLAGNCAMSSCCGGSSSKSSSLSLSSSLAASTAGSSNRRADVRATAAGFRLSLSWSLASLSLVHCR
jgi:hypothetical protein